MKNREIFAVISAGKYKGKKLKLPSLKSTRSTKSILKESYFDTIQFDIIDEIFIEVFGGSGSMGLEALSRGAERSYFIEKDAKAFDILKQNCDFIDKQNSSYKQANSFEYFPSLVDTLEKKAFFYFDPPFCIRDGMNEIYEKVYNLIENIPQDKVNLITIEHMSSYKLPSQIGYYKLQKTKKFGKSSLSYYLF
ncbi:MAG: 16S rRNA (guanine(966)-N(2))-methyltransferase RsmD [Campylobacteraceae bacterium]|nr:16S rRNA (guanine(966)-N(2))-methyltransferase RsmD [Campylobacteraceae bacterium]